MKDERKTRREDKRGDIKNRKINQIIMKMKKCIYSKCVFLFSLIIISIANIVADDGGGGEDADNNVRPDFPDKKDSQDSQQTLKDTMEDDDDKSLKPIKINIFMILQRRTQQKLQTIIMERQAMKLGGIIATIQTFI